MTFFPKTFRNRFFKQQGFTLLELLLGLLLFSLIGVTLYSVFSTGLLVRERFGSEMDVYQEMILGLGLMERDLENMVPYNFENSYPDQKSFQGGQDQMTLFQATDSGLVAVRYYLEDPQDGSVHKVIVGSKVARAKEVLEQKIEDGQILFLYREQIPFIDFLNQDFENADRQLIVSCLAPQGLTLSYGTLQDGASQKSWLNSWNYNTIPALVRIEMTCASGDESKSLTKDVLIPSGSLVY